MVSLGFERYLFLINGFLYVNNNVWRDIHRSLQLRELRKAVATAPSVALAKLWSGAGAHRKKVVLQLASTGEALTCTNLPLNLRLNKLQ